MISKRDHCLAKIIIRGQKLRKWFLQHHSLHNKLAKNNKIRTFILRKLSLANPSVPLRLKRALWNPFRVIRSPNPTSNISQVEAIKRLLFQKRMLADLKPYLTRLLLDTWVPIHPSSLSRQIEKLISLQLRNLLLEFFHPLLHQAYWTLSRKTKEMSMLSWTKTTQRMQLTSATTNLSSWWRSLTPCLEISRSSWQRF